MPESVNSPNVLWLFYSRLIQARLFGAKLIWVRVLGLTLFRTTYSNFTCFKFIILKSANLKIRLAV